MRSKGTWVALFYIVSTLIVTMVLNLAISDVFAYFRQENTALLGPNFTLSTLLSLILASSIAIYAGFINKRSRAFVDESVVELEKVAWPSWDETRVATFTVMVTCVIAAAILGVFDSVFGWLTNNNLFLG